MRALVAVLGALLVSVAARAQAADAHRPFILDRGSVEVIFGSGGWRTGVSPADANPGFSVFGGGGEIVLGIDVVPGIGIIATGRVLAGSRLSGLYLEGLGSLGAQIRLSDWVRVRGGAAAGQARLARNGTATDSAVLVGGFLAAAIDLFRLGQGRAAAEIVLRIDGDGHLALATDTTFAKESVAITLGVGFRF